MSFGREKAWLGAALAAFGVGCGEGGEERDKKDNGDKKIKIEDAIVGQDEVVDDELYIPDKDVEIEAKEADASDDAEISCQGDESEDAGIEYDVESETQTFRNVLMEEADAIKPCDWMKDKYGDEVVRLKEKLPRELWENKFDESLEQLHKFFVPRKDEVKYGVIGLLGAVKEGKETKFFANKEYRDNVKLFAEKYGTQYGVPVEVIYGVMAVENAGKHDPRRNSADGAYGIMQVQPGVVKHLAEMKFNGEDWDGVLVADLEGNIRAGVAYLSFLNDRYGQWSFSLMAYNSGPGRFENRMAGGETEKEKIRKKRGGWKKQLEDKNLWWACSRNGRAFLKNGNAGYATDAMYLGKPMQEIMESEEGEVKLTPLVKEMK